jgi:RsiW-degrading membrane proteinase PrsW (M82 family)
MRIVSLFIATIIPLIFLYIIYTLDLYHTGAFRYVIICFLWGGLAFAGASVTNRFIYDHGWASRNNIIQYVAPVVEETLKAVILLYLVRKPNFTYFVDGAIYGFASGIGFAIFENYQYILQNMGGGMGLAIGRVLSTNLIHASASALVGISLGLARFRRSAGHLVLLTTGLILAIVFHSIFNHLVIRITSGMLLLYAALIGFGGAGLIAFFMKRGLAEEKTWIEETLGVADRVTTGEARVVHRLENVDEILAPFAERFGPEKATQIEEFLVIQARLGILRKTLEKLNDEKMLKGVELQMADLRVQMDKARRSVGAYGMLYLRHIFPEESSPLWGRLENLIKERASARPASGGPNLWTTLGQRTSKPASSPTVNDQKDG